MTEKKKPGIKIKMQDVAETQDSEPTESAKDTAAPENEEKKKTYDLLRELEAELEKAKKEAEENHDRYLRVSAEFENYKKRSAREMDDFRKYANELIIKELLPVIDNLERAIQSCDADQNTNRSIAEGVHMTHSEILKVLEKFKVQPIDALGKPFDPAFHQAVMQEETEENKGQTVLKEFQKGYLIHERLLRPTMAVVSKPKEPDKDEDGDKKYEMPEQNNSEKN